MTAVPVLTQVRSAKFAPLRGARWNDVLTPRAVEFLTCLSRIFEPRRRALFEARRRRQAEFDDGALPDFLPHTGTVRRAFWTVAPIPKDLLDHRVEITGPADRKTLVNALNSGANIYVADLEDATSPTWANVLDAQVNLRDAVHRDIAYVTGQGRLCELTGRVATLMVRPRGWRLEEKHFTVDGRPVSASLFDFGLFFFHNARELVRRGSGPYFCLSKLENHEEACLWNDIFVFSQEWLRIPRGTIRSTVKIDTVTAAFEMDEILHELRDHSVGLQCGGANYLTSLIRSFRNNRAFVLPDDDQLGMCRHFLRSYTELLVATCHRRGAQVIGDVATQTDAGTDPPLHEGAHNGVRKDHLRQVAAGFDGTSVAEPALVPVARAVFDTYMHGPNQIGHLPVDVNITGRDLLTVPGGRITESGLRRNIAIAIRLLDAWMRGTGRVSVYNRSEDTATADFCCTQVWQWVKFGAALDDGRPVTDDLVRELIASELKRIRLFTGVENFHKGLYRRASAILQTMMTGPELPEFLTVAAYNQID